MTFVTPTPYKTTGVYLAQADRRVMQTLAGGFEGVVGAGDLAVSADAPASLRVSVAAGRAFVNGDSVARQGAYMIENDGALLSPYAAAAHATLPRRDLLVARVYDPSPDGGGAASDSVVLELVTGTPAASPTTPTTPPNAIPLAYLAINAAATTVSSIVDMRPKLPPPAPGGEGQVLPFNPVDGQTFRWVPTLTGTQVVTPVWDMVYRASEGRWRCSGGEPAAVVDEATVTNATTTYSSLGPTITPLASGDYTVGMEGMLWAAATTLGYMSVRGAGLADDAASIDGRAHLAGYGGNWQFDRKRERTLTLTANAGLVLALRTGTAAVTMNMSNRRLTILPRSLPPTLI